MDTQNTLTPAMRPLSIIGMSFFGIVVLLGTILFHTSTPFTETAHAGAGDNVSGWAWSSNIGWISLNCDDTSGPSGLNTCASNDFGVHVDSTTGDFSGYAWSSNIGWIHFAPSSEAGSGCTTMPCNAKVDFNTGIVTGWARACTVFLAGCSGPLKSASALGGWDGWIKMDAAPVNGVNLNLATNQFGGFAWGGLVVGWVEFFGSISSADLVAATPVVTTPLATPGTVAPGEDIGIRVDVRNDGATTAGPYNIELRVDNNNDDVHDYVLPLVRVNANTLPGTSQTIDVPWTVPLDALISTNYRVGYYADSNDEVDEGAGDGVLANWSGWSAPFRVIPPPSVNFGVGGCQIPTGGTECMGNVSWTFNYVQAPENYQVRNTTTGLFIGDTETSGGTIQRPLQFGLNRIVASANGVNEERTATAGCLSTDAWYNGVCTAPPSIDVIANPKLIRRGDTTNVTVTVDSPHPVTCTVLNAQATAYIFNHVPPSHQVSITTKAINAKQVVSVSCLDTNTGLTGVGEATIEVVPTVQEI